MLRVAGGELPNAVMKQSVREAGVKESPHGELFQPAVKFVRQSDLYRDHYLQVYDVLSGLAGRVAHSVANIR